MSDFYQDRSSGIGCSEIFDILSGNARDVWKRKVGLSKSDSNMYTELGNLYEPVAFKLFQDYSQEIVGWKCTLEKMEGRRHPTIPWLFGSVDGIIKRDDGKLGVLEIKTAINDEDFLKARTQGPRPQAYVQVQSHLLWPEFDFGVVFIFSPSFTKSDLKYGTVCREYTRDEELQSVIKERCARFWDFTSKKLPLPADFDKETTVELPTVQETDDRMFIDDDDLAFRLKRLKEAKSARSEIDSIIKDEEQHLKTYMGEKEEVNAKIVTDEKVDETTIIRKTEIFTFTYKYGQPKQKPDTEAAWAYLNQLSIDHPELAIPMKEFIKVEISRRISGPSVETKMEELHG